MGIVLARKRSLIDIIRQDFSSLKYLLDVSYVISEELLETPSRALEDPGAGHIY